MDFSQVKKIQDSRGFDIFSRNQICLERGEGCKLFDTEGRQYIDFMGGIAVNCLGYGNAKLAEAIESQCRKLMHCSNLFYEEQQARLLKILTEGTGFARAFLCNSGAEANEAAIKLARKYYHEKGQAKYKFVTALNSFHGRTLTTATATGQEKYSKPYAPLTPGFSHVPFNDIEALEKALTADVCAVILETIQGEGGVIPAAEDYLKAARKLTEERDILLIIDEVQTGVMRCGKLFSFELYGIMPDIATLAKGLGGGFPIGAMLAVEKVAKAFKKGDHGSTFGGNPLACAAANAVLEQVNSAEFGREVERKGDFLKELLNGLSKYPFVGKPRGAGLLVGLPLSLEIDGKKVAEKMLGEGFIINCAGSNTLRFAPPLIISEGEISEMAAALDKVLSQFSKTE